MAILLIWKNRHVLNYLKMHDTDSLLKNITGSENYVKELEKLTGNIENIDLNYFDERLKEITEADKIIRSIMKNTPCELSREFFELSINSRLNNPYDISEKKSKNSDKKKIKKTLADELRPRNMIKSPYFKIAKKLEKKCNELIESYEIDKNNPRYEQVEKILKTNPDLMSVKNLFGYVIKNDDDTKIIVDLQKASSVIIGVYMEPLYDVHKTMDKNWGMISKLFNSMAGSTSSTEVKEILYLFVVAKYRCTITDNDKYYMKLFLSVINKAQSTADGEKESGESSSKRSETGENGENITNEKREANASDIIGKMDPARFLELLDTINIEQIDKKQNVYKFAMQSKEIIRRIVNRKEGEKMEDIMKDVQAVLQSMRDNPQPPQTEEEETKGEETKEDETATMENADILGSLQSS